MVLGGTNELPWPRCFQIGATLDALLPFLKSGGLKGHLKEVSRGPRSAAVPYGEADYLICFVLKIRWPLLVCPLSVLPIPALYVPLLINKKKSVVYVTKKKLSPFLFLLWFLAVGRRSRQEVIIPELPPQANLWYSFKHNMKSDFMLIYFPPASRGCRVRGSLHKYWCKPY